MKKAFKIIGWIFLVLIVSGIGFGAYMYRTNSFIKALVDNDESKLYYFPVKGMEGLEDFKYEEIALQVEDTITVYGYFFKPETDSVKASIFLLHGAGGNVGRYAKAIEPLVDNGFQVYSLDWRGFGKSNGSPLHVNVLADTKVAFDDMLAREEVKNTAIIVYGMSMGGQVATRLTREREAQVDALVLDGSVASIPTLVADFAPYDFMRKNALENPDGFNQPYIALEDIKEIKNTPKLIIQSEEDPTVTPVRGKALFESAQEPKEFWSTKGGHIRTLGLYPDEALAKIEKLLK